MVDKTAMDFSILMLWTIGTNICILQIPTVHLFYPKGSRLFYALFFWNLCLDPTLKAFFLSSILPFFCFESVSHECTLVYLTSPTDKHLGCFQSFSILINNVGMNNCVHISFIYLLYTYIICIYKSICKINYPATNVQFRQF